MAKPIWDRHSIKAEVHRRGLTLSGIALDAGLYPNAINQGIAGLSFPGALALAKALDLPFEELFPTLYLRQQRKRKAAEIASQSATNCADTREAA